MSTALFDPRDPSYKSPFGAAACASKVRFCLRPRPGENIVRCVLLTHEEFADTWQETELSAVQEDGRSVFCGFYTAPNAGELVWYHFRLTWADGGESCYGKSGHCSWDDVEPWQLTVYDDGAQTPEWFGRGVTYQIFPDRFRRTKIRPVSGFVGDRTLHEHWDERMEYLPNEHGEVTCSDFFGGDLDGIAEKLDYLASLGVTTLYLNPIFEASTNHRYDTGDYRHVDPLLGTEEDFRALCEKARERGIRIMLDGVFNHTGANSIYFNAKGFYPSLGAAQSPDSPYADWYRFSRFPDEYDAWWGIKNLPAVEESSESYVNYIIKDPDSIVRRWLRCGASAWRLDVADELPDEFIAEIRKAMTEEKADSFLLGEVWEDGSNKIAYSKRRKYLLGHETNGLMNYPFRNALLAYLRGGDASDFREAMELLREHYPPSAFYSAMNFLSTHDTPRFLTLLGVDEADIPQSKAERADFLLNIPQLRRGTALLKLGALIMFSFPGSPSIYYGDEAGMQGFEDPFNRGTYPWGHENRDLVDYFARLGMLRKARTSLQRGEIRYLHAEGPVLAFSRTDGAQQSLTVCNAAETPAEVQLSWPASTALDALSGRRFRPENGTVFLTLAPREGLLLIESE